MVNVIEFPAIPSCFAALAFLLLALELAQSSSPNVPPLNDQTVFIRQQSRAFGARGALDSAQDEESLSHVYAWTFAGQILHMNPQQVIASLQWLAAAFVYRSQADCKFGPVADRLHVQHADLDGIILFAVFLHVDLEISLQWLAVRITISRFFCSADGSCWLYNRDFNARGDGRSTLLIAFSTAVAGNAGYPVFTRTLTCCLVTRFTCSSHRMAVTCFAGSAMCDGFAHISVETFFTVMTVSSGRVVSAVHTHSSALTARQFIQLHIEATATCVQITVTR